MKVKKYLDHYNLEKREILITLGAIQKRPESGS